MSLRGGVRCIGGICVFPLLGGLLCICTLCIFALLGLAIRIVGLILLLLTLILLQGMHIPRLKVSESVIQNRLLGSHPSSVVACCFVVHVPIKTLLPQPTNDIVYKLKYLFTSLASYAFRRGIYRSWHLAIVTFDHINKY